MKTDKEVIKEFDEQFKELGEVHELTWKEESDLGCNWNDVVTDKVKSFILSLRHQDLADIEEEVTFDAVGTYWEGEEHGWNLIAIKNGKVIWERKVLQPEIKSIYHRETGGYASDVTTKNETEVVAKYLYEQSLLKDKQKVGEE